MLDRGPKGVPPAGGSVRPGLHPPSAGGPPIVWWDPAVLELDVEEEASLRQQRILEPDPDGTAAAASEENYARWKPRATRSSPGIASIYFGADCHLARACRGWGRTDPGRERNVPRSIAKRPRGRRFGALVHSMLAAVDLNGTGRH